MTSIDRSVDCPEWCAGHVKSKSPPENALIEGTAASLEPITGRWFRWLSVCAMLLLATCLNMAPAGGANLTVEVEGLKTQGGTVRVGLFSSATADKWPYAEGVIATLVHPANAATVTLVFEDLAPGEYAVAALHDADDNGDMTNNFLGLPREGYGFSSGATGFLGPPSFNAARILIAPDDREVTTTISLHYP